MSIYFRPRSIDRALGGLFTAMSDARFSVLHIQETKEENYRDGVGGFQLWAVDVDRNQNQYF